MNLSKQLHIRIKTILTLVVGIICFASCTDSDGPKPPSPPTPEPVEARRTVLVYMVANNSLGNAANHYDINDLKEMQRAVSTGDTGTDGHLLVYRTSYTDAPTLYEVTPDSLRALKMYDKNTVSVSVDQMRTVLADMREYAPAADYGLVLWSHASGWLNDGIADEPSSARASTLSFGVDNNKRMNIPSLARALEGQNLSWLYFDCCYMASVEALYELRHSAPLIAASVTELPANGMDYSKNVKAFFAEPEADLLTACRNTFEVYDALSGSSRTCTMSLVKTEGLENLAALTRRVFEQAPVALPAGYRPQQFMTEHTCYHFDMANYIDAICTDPDLLESWHRALDDVVLYKASTPWLWNMIQLKYHSGLSIFILSSSIDANTKNYNKLQWYTDVTSALFD